MPKTVKNKKTIVLETSWDDGSDQDPYIAKLLRKYKLPGIFYLPGICTLDGTVISNLDQEFEVGSHTYNHPPDIKQLPNQEIEIKAGKRWLESIVGHEVKKFCYPRGRYNEETKTILRRLGITQARTTKVGITKTPRNHFERGTTVHVFQRPEYEGKDWLAYALEKLAEVEKKGGYFHVWGHGWEIERDKNWPKLEELFQEMKRVFVD